MTASGDRFVEGCALCPPRHPEREDRATIATLSISTLYLYGDQRFRGYAILAFDARHATSLAALDADEYARFMADLRASVRAIDAELRPAHMNVELLGNALPHLHWHIVPRYRDDPRWGSPIWGGWRTDEFNAHRQKLPPAEAAALARRIGAHLP